MKPNGWFAFLSLLALILAFAPFPLAAADDEAGFEPLFDGKTLDGWDGNPEFWSVQGRRHHRPNDQPRSRPRETRSSSGARATSADFELRLEFKIVGGNTGMQYRSKEVGKWVIGGYQADFDAAGHWAGTLYEEKGRGMLAKRGQKVVVPDGEQARRSSARRLPRRTSSPRSRRKTGTSYTIIAQGNHLVQKLNGITTVDLTDDDPKKRAAKGLLALQLHAGPPMTVQFRNIRIKKLKADDAKLARAEERRRRRSRRPDAKAKKIVFVAGKPSHGYGAHEHNAGCMLLAKELQAAMPGVEVRRASQRLADR